ncbi:TSUP family transporter [Corynebacterium uropygiale]|uniref:Probable membrane transporter protein n=1 Tax=Corynebacterium uropygiale TaxID=1775911 RepID=A0A9X1QME0_9CORY|nr:TSUP family transporter [Corynebacterium uropygiale]MCF4005606.1 TSUP family transporter [Corynebacterium uropygiale]
MTTSAWIIALLGAGLAGWVDAVIGGGGLLLIPILMAVAPQLSYATVLACNKVAGFSGTSSAAVLMVRKTRPPGSILARAIPLALVSSGVGAGLAGLVAKDTMRPIVFVLMVAVGLFVAFRPNFGVGQSRPWSEIPRRRHVLALCGVALIAFYDGIFGPGTGMFLIMVVTAVLSQDFVRSAALAKVVNASTNLGALIVFIIGGHVWWTLGLALAVANVGGALLGARTVLGGGVKLVRWALLIVVVIMAIYLSLQQVGVV